jgi:hypothetical protein
VRKKDREKTRTEDQPIEALFAAAFTARRYTLL